MDLEASERFTRLWIASQPAVSAFVHAAVPDLHRAEDLIQEVAATALRKFPEFDPLRPFQAWAIGIARNLALQSLRAGVGGKILIRDDLVSSAADAAAAAGDTLAEERLALRRCIEGMEGRVRSVLQLRYEQDLKPRDIAGRMRLAANLVSQILCRARRSLLECVERHLRTEKA